ncbi:MAG TPA: hypothetical protein VHY91_22525 [Pirellulales bacterium]|jgi:hypothetical protein|nr:hypothetical protein [Pirellulales bacterium]HEX4146293.1 hypothetical protein [Pirellulales bacterium]
MSNPYESPVTLISPPAETGNPITEGTIFKCWLIFFLMATVLGFFAGIVIGVVFGGVMGAMGGNVAQIQRWSTVLGFFVGIPVSYICFRSCVNRFVIAPLLASARVRKLEVPQ